MRESLYIFCIALFMVAFSACSKVDTGNDLPYITFGVSGMDIESKALITENTLANNAIYVYGVRNNTNKIYNKAPITRKENSNNWSPSDKRQWIAGSSYSFYAYTCSPAASASAPSGDNGGIYVDESALKINVLQPKSYNENNMVDYILSHAYKVADGSNYRTVMLYMEHAMAWVEIVVKKEMSEHKIILDSITLKNIFRSASMQCESQAIANSGEKNIWMIQLQGTNDLTYSNKSFTANGNILGSMNLLAIPQQLTSSAELKISYSVDEDNNNDTDPTQYTQTFKLFNYRPFVWESGNKITYTLTINTGVSLRAEIADWKDAGYTEGVILPSAQNAN